MSLEPLNWRYFRINFPSVTADSETIINAVYNAFKATKYADGSTRTPGSGVAWTSTIAENGTRIFTPPSPTKTFSVQMDRYRAGITSLQSAVIGTFSYGAPVISYTIDGTYSATNVASPVSGGGRWFGWVELWSSLTYGTFYVRSIDVFESQDALIICPIRSDGFSHPLVIGGFIDPQITSQNSFGYSAETDGKIYGLSYSGHPGNSFNQGYVNRSFLATQGSFLGTDSYTQTSIMNPRISTLLNIKKLLTMDLSKIPSSATCSIDNGFGTVAKIPMFACTNKRFIGRYREFYFYKRSRGSQTVYENGQPIGYTVGYQAYDLGPNDTILITR